jgi:hypothetical protein
MARPAHSVFSARCALTALALAVALPATAALKWESMEASVKVRAEQTVAHTSYGFVNAGDKPVTITNIYAGCSCTSPRLAKNTYAPGERGEIQIVFDPRNREGLYRASITVTSDDSVTTTLQFAADIESLVSFDTRFVYWKPGEPRTPKHMRLTFAEGHPANLAELTSSDHLFTVSFKPVGDSRREFDIEVVPPAEAINYTVITIRALVGVDQAERSFNVVARTMPAPAAAPVASQTHP